MRPVEMTGIVNRTQDFSQLKHNDEQKNVINQTAFANQMDKQIKRANDTVVKKQEFDLGQQKYDAKEKGKNTYFSSGKQKEKEKKKEDGIIRKKEIHSSFDVSI